jgi:hypothetical protein
MRQVGQREFGSALLLVSLMLVGAGTASAEGSRTYRASRANSAAPVKDCTPFNGRFGYYGNPWCTAAEQVRWNRWDASRRR